MRPRVLLVSANRERHPSPVVPLGLLYVGAATRAVADVELLDLCFEAEPHAALTAALGRVRPDVVGVGIRNLSNNAYGGAEALLGDYRALGELIRRRAPEATLVLGGAGFSLRADELVRDLGAHHGVVGEGERRMPELVQALARGERPARLLFADPVAPDVIAQGDLLQARPEAARPTSLDELLPARDLLDPRYFTVGDGCDGLQTRRGCPFRCAYCSYPDIEGRAVRLRDPERVADELCARAADPAVRFLFFVDSVFNVPRTHALAVCRAIERRGAPLPWVCYLSPADVDAELVSAMARAGCVGVEVGSDAGSDETLRRLRKPFGLEALSRTHALLQQAGVRDCHTFVIGAFGETALEARRTLRFVEQLDPDAAIFVVWHDERSSSSERTSAIRAELLELLATEAASHPGWIVPELGIRHQLPPRAAGRPRLRGPTWLHLARWRRALPGARFLAS